MDNIKYISADIASPLVMVKADVTRIPCSDKSFDVLLCNHVLEHVIDDRAAMRELFRVLKSNGWAVLQSPVAPQRDKTLEDSAVVSPKDRARVFGHPDHVRIYGRDYKDRLETAGFAVKVDGYVKELGVDAAKRYGLLEHQNIYFCTKP